MHKILALTAFFTLFCSVSAQDECTTNNLCTSDFCDTTCAPQDCDLPSGEECEGMMLPFYDNTADFCGCCPLKCVTYLKEGEACPRNLHANFPEEMCGPQLSCQNIDGSFKCGKGNTTCLRELNDYQNLLNAGELGMNMSPPDCDDEGYYEPIQCQRNGFCRCVTKDTGTPIFGFTRSETERDEQGQKCDCARNHYEALEQGCRMTISYGGDADDYQAKFDDCMSKSQHGSTVYEPYFSGHMRCLGNGNFDVIQCVSKFTNEDMCFCMDEDFSVNGTITYQSVITDLKCFDKDVHPVAYFQPCEKIRHDNELRRAAMSAESRSYYDGGYLPNCSPDGFFDKVQHDPHDYNRVFCSDRDGHQIEEFESTMDDSRPMNCECAWARRYLGQGRTLPTCEDNGSFTTAQCQSGECFCVDEYGRQVDKEEDQFDFQGCL